MYISLYVHDAMIKFICTLCNDKVIHISMFSQLIKACVYHSGHDAQVLQASTHFCKGAL